MEFVFIGGVGTLLANSTGSSVSVVNNSFSNCSATQGGGIAHIAGGILIIREINSLLFFFIDN
jgi:hypothetical protein